MSVTQQTVQAVKRVASAVGEGSVVISNVWEYVRHASV
jgi:hypothetical protein